MNKRRSGLRDWLVVLLSLLDDLAVLAIIILGLRFLGVSFTLPIIGTIAVLLAGYVFLMHHFIVPALSRKKETGSEGMIGLEGKVVKALNPVGEVRVGGEYWRARASEGQIEAGETIEVAGIRDLTLEVRRKSR